MDKPVIINVRPKINEIYNYYDLENNLNEIAIHIKTPEEYNPYKNEKENNKNKFHYSSFFTNMKE